MPDAFNVYVYAVEDGYEAEVKDGPNTTVTGYGETPIEAIRETFRLAGWETE